MLPKNCLKWWIIPIDGYIPEAIASAAAMLLVTGPSEIGYLAFMFLMYPLFASTGGPHVALQAATCYQHCRHSTPTVLVSCLPVAKG